MAKQTKVWRVYILAPPVRQDFEFMKVDISCHPVMLKSRRWFSHVNFWSKTPVSVSGSVGHFEKKCQRYGRWYGVWLTSRWMTWNANVVNFLRPHKQVNAIDWIPRPTVVAPSTSPPRRNRSLSSHDLENNGDG